MNYLASNFGAFHPFARNICSGCKSQIPQKAHSSNIMKKEIVSFKYGGKNHVASAYNKAQIICFLSERLEPEIL